MKAYRGLPGYKSWIQRCFCTLQLLFTNKLLRKICSKQKKCSSIVSARKVKNSSYRSRQTTDNLHSDFTFSSSAFHFFFGYKKQKKFLFIVSGRRVNESSYGSRQTTDNLHSGLTFLDCFFLFSYTKREIAMSGVDSEISYRVCLSYFSS